MTEPDDGPSIPVECSTCGHWSGPGMRKCQRFPPPHPVTESFHTCGEWEGKVGDQNE